MKKTLAFLLSVAMVLTMGILIPFGSAVSAEEITYGATNAGQVAGDYTPDENAEPISNISDLNGLEIDGNYYLTCDIDAGDQEYVACQDFQGTLDGNGHKIYNLASPLFGTLSGATIKNLTVESAFEVNEDTYTDAFMDPDGNDVYAAGAVAQASTGNATFENVKVNSTITVTSSQTPLGSNSKSTSISSSGFIGIATTGTLSFTNCEFTGSIVNNATCVNGNAKVGYVSGFVEAQKGNSSNWSFINCTISANLTANNKCGGFSSDTRDAKLTAKNCLATGALDVGVNSGAFFGYLGGGATTDIQYCKNTGNIISTSPAAGGIIGKADNDCVVKYCINEGNITCSTGTPNNDASLGGIIGSHRGTSKSVTIDHCTNSGNISTSGMNAAGILGSNRDGKNITITNCENSGNVTTVNGRGAGILGCLFPEKNKKDDGTGDDTFFSGNIIVQNCSNSGTITTTAVKDNAGGIIGYFNPRIKNANQTILFDNVTNTGTVNGQNGKAGGIAGYINIAARSKLDGFSIAFNACINEGAINDNLQCVGGIAGQVIVPAGSGNGVTVNFTDCENNGAITQTNSGQDSHIGGIIGNIQLKGAGTASFDGCVNNGEITAAGTGNVAGIVGRTALSGTDSASITNCENNGVLTATGTAAYKPIAPSGSGLTIDNSCVCNHVIGTDGKCTLCHTEVVKFTQAQGTIGTDLTLDFTACIDPNLVGDISVKFTRNNKSVVVDGEAGAEANTFVFSYTGINPQCMGDEILAELYLGEEVIATKTYSFKQYVENVMSDYEDNTAMLELCVATLKYGAAAQVYAQYKTDALVDEEVKTHQFVTALPEFSYNMKKMDSGAVDAEVTGAGIYFDNALHVYFTVTSEASSLKVLLDDEVVEPTMISEGVYRVISKPIAVRDIENSVEITLFNGDIQGQTVTYSITDYMLRTYARGTASEAMKGLLDALSMLYATAEANA